MPALPGPRHCVLAFTAHHVIAADIDEIVVRQRIDPDDLSQPMSAGFLMFLAGWLGTDPGPIDLLMVAPSAPVTVPDNEIRYLKEGNFELWRRDDLHDHPRVLRAGQYRPELVVYADRRDSEPDGVLIIGQGVAGRWEMAYEVAPLARGRGLGRRLAAAASSLVHGNVPLFAQVSPGNSVSVRACLAAGYTPIGSEVLFAPH
ncbi:MAG: hypothetical protein QOD92_1746 [Acidimicrobiaceae bacterium]